MHDSCVGDAVAADGGWAHGDDAVADGAADADAGAVEADGCMPDTWERKRFGLADHLARTDRVWQAMEPPEDLASATRWAQRNCG